MWGNRYNFNIPEVYGLASEPIDKYMMQPWDSRDPERVAMTIIHRLAHLIYRVESNPLSPSTPAAAWYLRHMLHAKGNGCFSNLHPQALATMDRFQARLERALEHAGTMYGNKHRVDGKQVIEQKIAELDRMFPHRCPVASPPGWSFIEPERGTPDGDVSRFISDWMWRQCRVASNMI